MVSSTRGTRGTKILFARKGERRSRGGGRVASIPKNRAILNKTHHSDPPKPHAPFLAAKKSVFPASLAQFKEWFKFFLSAEHQFLSESNLRKSFNISRL